MSVLVTFRPRTGPVRTGGVPIAGSARDWLAAGLIGPWHPAVRRGNGRYLCVQFGRLTVCEPAVLFEVVKTSPDEC